MPLFQLGRRRSAPFAVLVLAGLLGACSQSADSPLEPRLAPGAPSRLAAPGTPHVVISQVYGSGGNSGATVSNDYVELFNQGTTAVSLAGWSIQYASATGTGAFGSSASQLVALGGTIQPGGYYLVQLAGASGASLAGASAVGTINMSGTAGKVALVDQTAGLGCNGSSALPCDATAMGHIVDLVGFGGSGSSGANFYEGTGAAPAASGTNAVFRKGAGCTDTNDNAADFSAAPAAPRNAATTAISCGTTPPPATVAASISPAATTTPLGNTVSFTAAATSGGSPAPITGAAWTSSAPAVATIDPATGVATAVGTGTTTIGVTVTTASGTATASTSLTVTNGVATSTTTVSEIHYDNVGSPDAGEAIEIEGDANSSLDGWSLVLYNGNGGVPYGTTALSGLIPATCGARGVVTITFPPDGIQNGSPDGWALVNALGQVVEFKSYEGTFAATSGPATGLTSTPIDADETTPTATTGQSAQRARNGVWFGPVASTFGACNALTPPPKTGSVTLSSGKTSLAFAMQTQFFYGGTDLSGQPVTSVVWSTSDASVITVDARGIVTAKGVGTAQLIATAPDGASGSVSITVYLSQGSAGIRLGHNTEFGEPQDGNASDDFLIRRAQYTVSYNPSRGGANWVSWNLDASHLGGSGRCPGTCYSADTALTNAGITAYTTADWVSNSTWDRGHMAPSADWTSSEADNNTTFFLTNFLPQAPDLNQGPWEQMESALRDSVAASRGSREAYIIAGGIFTNGVGLGSILGQGKIQIPDSTWKVVVLTPAGLGRNADNSLPAGTQVFAVNMPNVQGIRGVDWTTYLTTVAKIERSTGYDLLALLAESTECRVEGRNCAPTARIAGPTAANEGQTLAFDASTSSDPDAGNTLSYQWSVDGQTVGIGASLSQTFVDNGTYAVRLIVADQGGAADTTQTMVTVANVAPAVGALADATLAEGGTFSASGSFVDPGADTHTATVDYGDGSGVQTLALSGKTFALSHAYADNGTYAVKVTVTESDLEAAKGSATATVTVTNVAPSVSALPSATLLRGESYAATGTASDVAADTYTATVNYGDGAGAQPLALSGGAFSLSHAYATAGTKTVTVTVTDDDGATTTRTATVTVLSAAQGIAAVSSTIAGLGASGKLDDKDVKWLSNKLDGASDLLAKGNVNAAGNQLDEVLDRIEKIRAAGGIANADAAALSAYVRRIAASIG